MIFLKIGSAEILEKIISKDNRRIKLAARLAAGAGFRREQGLFFLEGARLCSDARESGAEIEALFVTQRGFKKYEKLVAPCADAARLKYEISEELSKCLSDTQSPQGVFCICKILDKPQGWNTINTGGMYLALENVQGPPIWVRSAEPARHSAFPGFLFPAAATDITPRRCALQWAR